MDKGRLNSLNVELTEARKQLDKARNEASQANVRLALAERLHSLIRDMFNEEAIRQRQAK